VRHDEYAAHDATGLAELVRTGQVNRGELVAAANARIDAVNDAVNAVVHRIDPSADVGDDVDGPFAGVPFVLKDMDGRLAGHPASYGSRALAGWVPDHDSELIRRYKAAGLRIIGKTNCPELGIMGVTEPELHGPTRNPWNHDHVPGGSSGGSAAAVAAGIVPVASAGDGGGSIRIPAAACGLFGLKPTRGLMPLAPEGDPWMGLVSRHVLTRSVRDSAALLDATSGPFPGSLYAQPRRPRSYLARLKRAPRRLTVGLSRRSFLDEPLHPDCVAAVDDAAALLESLGHRIVELELPMDHAEVAQAYLTIVAAAVAADIRAIEVKTGEAASPGSVERPTWFLKQVGDALSARELYEAHELAATTALRFGSVFGGPIDVHLSATMAAPPAKVGELGIGTVEKVALTALQRLPSSTIVLRQALARLAHDSLQRTPNTQVFNLTGQPAMSLPLWVNCDNLPIGVQVAGPFGSDELLLRLAQQVHEARPWADRLPEISGT
jgi:amidase